MFRGSLEDGMTCPNQAAQVSEQGFKICLYRLE
jgi:radical SAM superfamily enzyme